MKQIILAAGLFAAMLSAPLHAQTMNMKASIPFDFRIGSTTLPSGEYWVRHSGGLLFVKQTGGNHKSGIYMTVGEDRPAKASGSGTLQFNRYGDTYFLTKVWTPEDQVAATMLKGASEKELASHIGLSGTSTVALISKEESR